MAYYKPCKNCAAGKASCPRRDEISNAIAGLSVPTENAGRKPHVEKATPDTQGRLL